MAIQLLACALACYTAPWQRGEMDHPQTGQLVQEDIITAEAYYFAAKKRIGLLGWTLIDIQCLFFASVYEKIKLNPLQAWFYIQQASSRLQAHLKRRAGASSSLVESGMVTSDQHLEQHAFWSVYKAEQELLPELPFQSSGIEELTRADSMFPTPPASRATMARAMESADERAISEERSWAFYLAEISIRRTINDTILTLYRKGAQYWLTHTRSLLKQCEDCETQIQLWYSHLPPSIRFETAGQPDNELSFFLQGRFYQWRAYVLTPLLYCVLHNRDHQTMSPDVLTYAQEAVEVCANSILHNNNCHRHGGTWFVCRGSFSSALLILGVVLKANPELAPPAGWDALVIIAINTLQRWESQSGEVRRLRKSLEQLAFAICDAVGIPPIDLANPQ